MARPQPDVTQHLNSFGDNSVNAQQIGELTINQVVQQAVHKMENAEALYTPPPQRPNLTETQQQSNVARKLGPFGSSTVAFAQQQRADALVLLEKYSSLSPMCTDYLGYVIKNLRVLYYETYVVQSNRRHDTWAGYDALLAQIQNFSVQFNQPDRLPLDKPFVLGLLFNETGFCTIDWQP